MHTHSLAAAAAPSWRGEGDFLRVEGAAPSPCRLLLHRHSHLSTISPSTVRMQICCVMYCVHLILQSSAPAAAQPTHRHHQKPAVPRHGQHPPQQKQTAHSSLLCTPYLFTSHTAFLAMECKEVWSTLRLAIRDFFQLNTIFVLTKLLESVQFCS
jgi:hypothetical protein